MIASIWYWVELVLVEVVAEPVTGAERQQAEDLLAAEQVALLRRVEVLDLAAQAEMTC